MPSFKAAVEAHSNSSGYRSEAGFRRGGADADIQINGGDAADISSLPGRLIAVEGTDGAGRSTQLALLREWLETRGFGVAHTALTRSQLAGEGLRQAKEGHTLGRLTMDLYYATDFADRLENEIIPALRAGFVVLADRYVYSMMARSIVRGGDPEWIRDVYRFAPRPDAVFYLKISLPKLTQRVMAAGGFDYWESGMDFQEEHDVYQSFVRYQTRLLAVFDDLSERYKFSVVDADGDVRTVFKSLSDGVLSVVGNMTGARP
ncbi:MAG TPA: thymidylate kinase [Phycisphaerales bacterium]|nr:thymidylate kinase [Phycisphaerales bacterium]